MTPPPTSPNSPSPAAQPPKAFEHASKRDWPAYFKAVEGKGPRETLLKALELFEKDWAAVPESRPARHLAIDLGCGSGRDTFELLKRGWHVLATDSSELAIDLLRKGLPADQKARLECRFAGFEALTLPRADLVNASYALPFCDPPAFPRIWNEIIKSLPIGGRFAGQFFGPRDDWAALPDRTHHTRSQVEQLLDDFTIEYFQEVENREAGVTGKVKNWHIFHVVARRRA